MLRYAWSPHGGITPGQETTRNPIIIADSTRTYTITASHPNCPTLTRQLTIIAEPNPVLSLGADTLYKCLDVELTLKGSVTPEYAHYMYRWDSLSSLEDLGGGMARYNGADDETIILTVSTPHDCSAVDTQWIQAGTTPLLTLNDSAEIKLGDTYQLSPESDASSYRWYPASFLTDSTLKNPLAKPVVNTKYFVVATNSQGCSAIDSIYLRLQASQSDIYMPNAFTPGRDPNPILKVLHSGTIQLRFLRIYNRWGTLMFETKNIHTGWDGSYQGTPQPAGVYVYIVEAVDEQTRKLVKTGNITLLR